MLIQVKKNLHFWGEIDLRLGKQRSHLCIYFFDRNFLEKKKNKLLICLIPYFFPAYHTIHNQPHANNIS